MGRLRRKVQRYYIFTSDLYKACRKLFAESDISDITEHTWIHTQMQKIQICCYRSSFVSFLLFQNQIKFIFLGENVLHFSLWTSVCYPYLIFFCSFIFFVDYKTKLKKENSEIQTSKENKTNI